MAKLLIQNLQSIVRVNRRLLRSDVQLIRKIMEIEKFDVSISLVNDEEIQRLNHNYRNVDKPTDVLSFSFRDQMNDPTSSVSHNAVSSNANLSDEHENEIQDLGDLYLGMPYIRARCLKTGFRLTDELAVLTVHGFSHLLGYDHEKSTEDFKRMYLFEFNILRQFDRITLPCDTVRVSGGPPSHDAPLRALFAGIAELAFTVAVFLATGEKFFAGSVGTASLDVRSIAANRPVSSMVMRVWNLRR
ncbi:putative ribonuclease [Hypsibius exemplaris]|uniref:Ribonuclease n=1 Tax=Hypsibius exemplaris TaxID=2072580 RepID=A0A9X6RKV0_HYPEX|nr:putative ribonuclease [Hypsibius exemplaris]